MSSGEGPDARESDPTRTDQAEVDTPPTGTGEHPTVGDGASSTEVSISESPVMPIEAPTPDPAAPSSSSGIPASGATGETPPDAIEIVEVENLDWQAVRAAVDSSSIRGRMRGIVERMESLLDQDGGPGLLFDRDRANSADQVIQVPFLDPAIPLWIVGDLHGDLLALEAALATCDDAGVTPGGTRPRIVFLGDLFDDEGFGLEVLLRIFELIVDEPGRVCVIAGNHDEALSYDGVRFASSVTPSDFSDFLNVNLAHEWIERTGKLAVRLFAQAPRAIFLPDGLLIAHGGFPLVDLHPKLAETRNWNDPLCLSDFVWTRAHPKARRKLPNRFSRGSQFGYEDFAAFCALSTDMGRPVARMVRGHDHVEDRYAVFPAYREHPLLTTVALSRRLSRESFGSYERVPTIARYAEHALPIVYRLHVPADMIRDVYPDIQTDGVVTDTTQGTQR